MRRTILALTVICFAPTAVIASTSGRDELVRDSAVGVVQKHQIAPGGLAGRDQEDSSGGNIILAKGDQSASGPGTGGQKGQKKGGGKGQQKEGKDNKGKGKS